MGAYRTLGSVASVKSFQPFNPIYPGCEGKRIIFEVLTGKFGEWVADKSIIRAFLLMLFYLCKMI